MKKDLLSLQTDERDNCLASKGKQNWKKIFFLPMFVLISFQFAQAQLAVNFNITEPTCFGLPTGSVTAVATGGTAPYAYVWSTGASTPTIVGVTSGTYTVTVVDALSQQIVQNVFVDQPSLVSVTFDADVCQIPFSVTANVSGGVAPYTYHWSTNASTPTISNLPAGDYCVTATDFNGCGVVECITLIGTPLSVSVVANGVTCFDGSDGSVTAFPSGGTPPYLFNWSNGFSGQTITNLSPGAYTVTLTDANGCMDTATGVVTNAPPIIVTPAVNNPTCLGDTNGSINLNVSGGTPGYTYIWGGEETTSFLNNLGPGTYFVTVTDANNCPVTAQFVLSTLSNLTVGALGTPETCLDFNDGFLTADVAGGVPPLTYTWQHGPTTQVVTDVSPGTYFLTVTDGVGCFGTAVAIVNPAPDFEINVTGSDITTCDAMDGVATATIQSGIGPFAYFWSNEEITSSISGLIGGLYSVTVTNGAGCITTGSVFINTPPAIFVSIQATEMLCFDESTGTATAIVTGGTMPFTYMWSNGAMTPSISNLPAGTYSVIVTDDNDCTATASVTITESPNLTVEVTATEIVCGAENTGSASVAVTGGTFPFTYMWSSGGTQNNVENLEDGTYTVTVFDALGCTGTAEFTINIIDDFTIEVIPRDVLCNGGEDGSVLVTASGGDEPYTYEWDNGMSGPEITGLVAGTYIVTVTEANDCKIIQSIVINEPALLTIGVTGVNPDCAGESTGSVTAFANGGTMPYTFNWSTEDVGASVSNLPAGTYDVTVTDANFCTAEGSVTLIDPLEMTLTVSSPIIQCAGTSSGSATALPNGGTMPYTYMWSNGLTTQTIADIPAGIYEVVVTDALGCQIAETTVSVQELPQIDIQFDVFDISCSNQNIGAITATISGGTGPYGIIWSNSQTSNTITGLAPGTYGITVTDANGCAGEGMATVISTPGLSVGATSTNVTCAGFNDGTATVIVSGGTGPFSYSWDNMGEDTPFIDGLAPGTYTVMVTDANECTGQTTVVITAPLALNLQTTTQDVNCFGEANGSATVAVTGGTAPYGYEWSSGSTTPVASGLPAGTYTILVTDANECTISASVTINQPPLLTLTISNFVATCMGTNAGTATAIANGGTPSYMYTWSNGTNGATVTGLPAGTHTVTVTDANNCTTTTSVTITNFPQPTCTINVLSEAILGGDGSLEVIPSSGTAPYTYLWSNGESTAIISGLNAGTHSVTVTDANGCSTTCAETLAAYSGIGNYVWEDINKDGIQDANEPGVDSIVVKLKDASGTVIDETMTDMDGFYIFTGLTPGVYSVMFVVEYPMAYTLINEGSNDAVDSDADDSMNGMTINTTLDPGEIDLTWDAGIYEMPNIDNTDPCFCLNNSTTEVDGQFSEEITIFSYPGETWTLLDPENLYLEDSPEPPLTPVLAVTGHLFEEVAPGVYIAHFKLIHEMGYFSYFTNGIDVISYENICRYPQINVTNLPPSDLCIWDDDYEFITNPEVPGEIFYYIDGVSVTGINPYELGAGSFELVVQLVPFDPIECIAEIAVQFLLTDDCSAKLGNFVWSDLNHDGIQDPGEPGIQGVEVIVTGVDEAENDFIETVYTDNTGMYMVMVPPGTYKVTFIQPPNMNPSPQNTGSDDAVDSDMDPLTGMTHNVTLGPNEMDMTIDAGFYADCVNITDPGAIGPNQFLCGPGIDADPILSLEDASGGVGELEYLWMMSVDAGPFNPQTWTPIPNSNSASYDPGVTYNTTYYARCARRVGCSTYIETSNVITVEVGSVAVAEITGPSYVCEDTPITYYAVGNGAGAVVEWDFGPATTPSTATGSPVEVTFISFGNFTISLSVTENGCTSTDYLDITVTNDPVNCGNGLVVNASVEEEASRSVKVQWEMSEFVPDNYVYEVEYSRDGETFTKIGEATPDHVEGGIQYFVYHTVAPKTGHNYYRVNIVADDTELMSDIAEVVLFTDSHIAMLYPNPVTDELTVELFDTYEGENISMQLISSTGKIVQEIDVVEGADAQKIKFNNLPSGTYFLKVRYGKTDVKTMKVLKY